MHPNTITRRELAALAGVALAGGLQHRLRPFNGTMIRIVHDSTHAGGDNGPRRRRPQKRQHDNQRP